MNQSQRIGLLSTTLILILSGFLFTVIATASDLTIFPAKGQSTQQQQIDTYECNQWAVTNSGVNPSNLAPPRNTNNQSSGRSALTGAAAGATVGGAAGAIGGSVGTGAALGAAAGAAAGAVRQNRKQTNTTSVNQQSQHMYQQLMTKYNKAYSVCLEAKGYTVK